MKSEKGITLITLIIYMIGITLTISILSILSTFFFRNQNYLLDNSRYVSEYNKFNMYFIKDIKNNRTAKIENVYQKDAYGNQVISNGNPVKAGMRIVLADGTVYTYRSLGDKDSKGKDTYDNGIYRNKTKICSKIYDCTFSIDPENNKDDREDGKRIITVNITINDRENDLDDSFTTTNKYVLRYW